MKCAKVTEAGFQKTVLEMAKTFGWRVAHFRPGLTKSGKWRTAVAADGKGFPDLVLARPTVTNSPGRLIFAELKVPPNDLTREQAHWIWLLENVAKAEVYVWTPAQWDEIERILGW